MADIFDLARNINRQKQQATQGYNSPLEDLPMQIMEIMDTRAKEKRVSLKQDAQILQQLIQSANTEEEINALTGKANSYLKETTDADIPFYGDFINNQVNEQRDSYYEAKNAMEWFGNKLDERTPEFDSVYSGIKRQEGSDRAQRHNNPGAHIWIPELEEKFGAKKGDAFTSIEEDEYGNEVEKTYYTAFYDDANKGDEASRFIAKRIWDKSGGDIDKFVSDYSKNKNPEELKGYADTIKQNLKNNNYLNYSVDDMMGFSLDEIEKRREEFERLAPGLQGMEKYGFKFNKGNYADATLKREMLEYGQRLDATLKAHLTGGILTEEEAGSIMRGTYKEDKASVLKKINDNMDSHQSNIAKIDKLILGQLDEDATSQILQQYDLEGMSGSQLQSELSNRRGQYQNALNLERKRQYAWEGLSQTAIEDDFRSNIDDDSGVKKAQEEDELPIGIRRLVYSPLHDPDNKKKDKKLTMLDKESSRDEDEMSKIEHVEEWDDFNKKSHSQKRKLESKKSKLESLRERGYDINEKEYDNISSQLDALDEDIRTAQEQIELAGGKDYAREMKKVLRNKKRIRETALQILEDSGAAKTQENFKNAINEAKIMLLKERGDIWGTKTHSQRVPGARTPAYRTGSRAARP